MSYLFRHLTPESLLYRWLLYWRWIPRTGLILLGLWVAVMAVDRKPPFKLLDYWTNQPRPGGVLVVRAHVQRDLTRDCSVYFGRFLFDRLGSRHESAGPQFMSPQAIRNMDALAPGQLNVQMQIPINFPAGPAVMTTVLEYRCNALHDLLRPINVEMNIPFEVLP